MKAELAVTDLARKTLPDCQAAGGAMTPGSPLVHLGSGSVALPAASDNACAESAGGKILLPAWVNAYGNQSEECAEINHCGDEMPGSF
jgi:hypothetical protein